MNGQPSQSLSTAIPENLARMLEDEIIYGRLAPKTRLTEEDIAARYNVSRSPVREALRLLERDGLVMRAARRGIWVSPVTLRDFDDLYICRIELEALGAEHAALSRDAARKAEFADIRREMQAAKDAGDAKGFLLADLRGGYLIFDLADNATLKRLVGTLKKQALRYRFLVYENRQSMVDLTMEGSMRIQDSIIGGRAAEAKVQTQELIREIWQVMRPVIAGIAGED
jgi:DNA-binding GntR family transcriptional regulator